LISIDSLFILFTFLYHKKKFLKDLLFFDSLIFIFV